MPGSDLGANTLELALLITHGELQWLDMHSTSPIALKGFQAGSTAILVFVVNSFFR